MICASSFSSKHHVHSFSISPTTFRLGYTCHHFYSTASSRCLCRWMGLPAIQINYVVWQCGIFQWKHGTLNVVCTCFNWLKVRLILEASSCTHSDSQQVYIFGRGPCIPLHFHYPLEGASKTHVLVFRSLRTPQSSNNFGQNSSRDIHQKCPTFENATLRFTLCNIPGASWQCPKKETCLEVEDFRV